MDTQGFRRKLVAPERENLFGNESKYVSNLSDIRVFKKQNKHLKKLQDACFV
jgi:hypothetical protein